MAALKRQGWFRLGAAETGVNASSNSSGNKPEWPRDENAEERALIRFRCKKMIGPMNPPRNPMRSLRAVPLSACSREFSSLPASTINQSGSMYFHELSLKHSPCPLERSGGWEPAGTMVCIRSIPRSSGHVDCQVSFGLPFTPPRYGCWVTQSFVQCDRFFGQSARTVAGVSESPSCNSSVAISYFPPGLRRGSIPRRRWPRQNPKQKPVRPRHE